MSLHRVNLRFRLDLADKQSDADGRSPGFRINTALWPSQREFFASGAQESATSRLRLQAQPRIEVVFTRTTFPFHRGHCRSTVLVEPYNLSRDAQVRRAAWFGQRTFRVRDLRLRRSKVGANGGENRMRR
jgi:hypothetical protein